MKSSTSGSDKFVWVNDLLDCDADYIDETARKLGTRLNEHRKSVQACDLKSAVSEYAKDAGHSIDWACADYWLGKPPAFSLDTR